MRMEQFRNELGDLLIEVLILVLMECGWNADPQGAAMAHNVLILVLMECGWNLLSDERDHHQQVLILVLMECGWNILGWKN